MIHRLAIWTLAAASLVLPLAAAADATEVGGVKYAHSVLLAHTRLQLNGAGVRYKAVFKVYTAGLYLSGRASTPEAVLAAAGPRRLHIVMLRDIDGNELGKLFTKGMEENSSRTEFSKLIPGIIRMSDIFSQRRKLVSGESFSIDYVPGTGVSILVNGQPTAEPIKEPEFFNAMMKIWLGKSPADARLKDALLGLTPAREQFN